MNARIVLLPGDGIGPDVMAAAVRVLDASSASASAIAGRSSPTLIGGAALRAGLPPLPAETLAAATSGGRGAARRRRRSGVRPPAAGRAARSRRCWRFAASSACLRIFGPARVWPGLEDAGPLKPEVLAGTDLVVVRELTGGLYYGEPRGIAADGNAGREHDALLARRDRARRARRVRAGARRAGGGWCRSTRRTCSRCRGCGATVVTDVAREYPDVTLTHEFVDAAAMKLALAPVERST